MSEGVSIEQALEANRRYAETFTPGAAGAPRLAIVLCMDARIDPLRALGLPYGQANIIRNAGGRVADALRSLAISQRVLGSREVAIVHHTECGMMTFTDDEMRTRLRKETGVDASELAVFTFRDLEDSVREDIELYRRSPFVRQDVPVRGFVYDVATGLLREVTEA